MTRAVIRGLAIGTVGILVTAALMALAGHADVTGVGVDAGTLALGALVFVVSGAVEELVFRLLVLGGVLRLTGSTALALGVSSLLFALTELLTTDGVSAVSFVSTLIGGVMYGVAYLRSRTLWLPIGIHVAWNFVQGTVLGFTVSGDSDYSGAVVHVSTSGARWLGGGAYGLEGSVFSLVGRAVIVLICVMSLTQEGRPRILLVSGR